jgi:hypothetical protein
VKRAGGLLSALLLSAALGACRDFSGAYGDYCRKTGNCVAPGGDAGNGNPDGGGGGPDGGNGGGPDGGGGGPDGGKGNDGGFSGPCLAFGSECNGYGQCCADAGLACGRTGFCEFFGPNCFADGFFCHQNSDCCNHLCTDAGICQECKDGSIPNQSCAHAVDCCYDFGVGCNTSNVCEYLGNFSTFADGYRCPSSDWCTGGFCKLVDAGAGAVQDGICTDAGTSCSPLGVNGGTCCVGTTSSTNGCCLPNNSPCQNDTSCCSGNCPGGVCLPSGTGTTTGSKCYSDGKCQNPDWCDFGSKSCEDHLCFPTLLPQKGGCGIISAIDINTFVYLDGGPGQCLMDFVVCATNSDCCSGICANHGGTSLTCAPISYY